MQTLLFEHKYQLYSSVSYKSLAVLSELDFKSLLNSQTRRDYPNICQKFSYKLCRIWSRRAKKTITPNGLNCLVNGNNVTRVLFPYPSDNFITESLEILFNSRFIQFRYPEPSASSLFLSLNSFHTFQGIIRVDGWDMTVKQALAIATMTMARNGENGLTEAPILYDMIRDNQLGPNPVTDFADLVWDASPLPVERTDEGSWGQAPISATTGGGRILHNRGLDSKWEDDPYHR